MSKKQQISERDYAHFEDIVESVDSGIRKRKLPKAKRDILILLGLSSLIAGQKIKTVMRKLERACN